MYCIKCGIELSKGQAICPICKTAVAHPDFPPDPELATYPPRPFQSEEYNRRGLMFVLTMLFAMLAVLPLLLEWLLFETILWSGFVCGGILLGFIIIVLPFWFNNPNPAIFVPSNFVAIGLYLFYINWQVKGGWFLSFALPVVTLLGLIITAMCTLFHYLRRGRLYILGGGFIALGAASVYLEFFIWYTFRPDRFIFWSSFPLVALFLMGMTLIVIAIVKPFKESLRKFFYI